MVDHQEGTTYLLCLAEDTPAGADGADTWLDQTAAFLRTVGSAERSPATPGAVAGNLAGEYRREYRRTRDGGRAVAGPRPRPVPGRYRRCQRELTAGESYEICVTNAAWLPAPGDPLDYHRLLRRYNPAPYAAFLQFGDVRGRQLLAGTVPQDHQGRLCRDQADQGHGAARAPAGGRRAAAGVAGRSTRRGPRT